jgi:hypothetical protein
LPKVNNCPKGEKSPNLITLHRKKKKNAVFCFKNLPLGHETLSKRFVPSLFGSFGPVEKISREKSTAELTYNQRLEPFITITKP